MILCAETVEPVTAELLTPPEGSQPGDIIYFEGFERKPPAELHAKKDPWGKAVQPKLKIDENGVACFESIPFKTEKGVVKSKGITNGIIK